MRKFVILFIAICPSVFSCNDEADHIELSIKDFTIEVPPSWTLEEVQGYDSYVRQINISEDELINIDLGWYSSNLNVDGSMHHITFMTIDNREAKIVKPKNYGQGTTGVYFDSLDSQGTKLQIHGSNLSKKNQRLLLAAIETIKFK